MGAAQGLPASKEQSRFFCSVCLGGSKATKHFTAFQNYRDVGKLRGRLSQSDNYSLQQGAEVTGSVPSCFVMEMGWGHLTTLSLSISPLCLSLGIFCKY